MAARQERRDLTVFGCLQHLFPMPRGRNGGFPYPSLPPIKRQHRSEHAVPFTTRKGYAAAPMTPFDVFAITGYLLELSGAYHHIMPQLSPRSTERESRAKRLVRVEHATIESCREIAKVWRAGPLSRERWPAEDAPNDAERQALTSEWLTDIEHISELWDQLFGEYGNAPIFAERGIQDPPPEWWSIALELFMIADEAARNIGFMPVIEAGNNRNWLIPVMLDILDRVAQMSGSLDADATLVSDSDDHSVESGETRDAASDDEMLEDAGEDDLTTLSCARLDVVAVLPKSRTTPVGCTLRSLSHHLALLPARGIARANWIMPLTARPAADESAFNLLLVPYPFSIAGHQFQPVDGLAGFRRRTGFFEVATEWLDAHRKSHPQLTLVDRMTAFVCALAQTARDEHRSGEINAVVFPEMALNYETFVGLRDRLVKHLPGLEVLISGLSDNKARRAGNFVGVSVVMRPETKPGEKPDLEVNTSIREKHHRWRLDRSQLEAYDIKGRLNPGFDWWEDIDLMSRRVDFSVFRSGSVLATMICEDLARVDPCQELLRAIGPNLVVALLMDAPQLKTRWPARYATILAEDPGSAVLTLTSRALMTLQHLRKTAMSKEDRDRVIALWRDDRSPSPIEIACPPEAHGVWLRIWGSRVTDLSLDGRDDNSAIAWQYGMHAPLVIPGVEQRFADVIGAEDIALRRTLTRDCSG